jgi:hypothetical protein
MAAYRHLGLVRWLCSCAAIAIAVSVVAFAGYASARDRWSTAEAWSWYHDQPRMFGANYVMTYAATPTEMWQADPTIPDANTFDIGMIRSELDKARDAGLNTLRVTLSYEVWKADRDGFLGRLSQFVDAAAERGIRPTFICWDDVNFTLNPNVPNRQPYLGPQADPVPGMHNSQWTGTGGNAVLQNRGNWTLPRTSSAPGAGAKEYIQDVIGAYAQDNRVLMWNAYNEPANGGQSVDNARALIQATASWARELDPVQPISFDIWGSGADGTAAAESDVISYHNYSAPASTIAGVKNWMTSGRPVMLTEWMARTFGSTIPDILPDLQEMGVASYNWGLVNGDQQTHWPWGSPPQTETTEPPLWFHDLFRRDGTAYKPEEIAMYQHYRLQDNVLRSADSRMVAIENPSFEADDLGGVPDALLHRQFQGWSILHEEGDWVGGTIVPDTWHFTEPVPDGTQAMFAVDVEVGQVLGETLHADTYYVLQVDVGHRALRSLPSYDIDLYAGGVELSPLTVGLSNPVEGQWTDASKVYQVNAGNPLVGSLLEVHLRSPGYETFFDNVRLVAVDSLQEIGQTSDLNLDGAVTAADWTLFLASAYADLSGYSPAQQFLHGDLDRDGDNDYDDFQIFRSDYIAANGKAAFEGLFTVPEPASAWLLLWGIVAQPLIRRRVTL